MCFLLKVIRCRSGRKGSDVERKEETIASKILIDFVRDFTHLTENQLSSVKKMMEDTVRSVMDSVMGMSESASNQKKKANEVLVHDAAQMSLVSSDRQEIEKREMQDIGQDANEDLRKNTLENQMMRAGGTFSKHMEALSRTDGELQRLVLKVVGSVSNDDLMAQRLSHVISSLSILRSELCIVLSDYKKHNTPDSIKAFRNRVLSEVYLSYTAESEKEIFHQLFGHPKEIRRVS